jgi:hypothetical protein
LEAEALRLFPILLTIGCLTFAITPFLASLCHFFSAHLDFFHSKGQIVHLFLVLGWIKRRLGVVENSVRDGQLAGLSLGLEGWDMEDLEL